MTVGVTNPIRFHYWTGDLLQQSVCYMNDFFIDEMVVKQEKFVRTGLVQRMVYI
jgi:hypothetical protein